jgi:SAM-dependent methyltransferase
VSHSASGRARSFGAIAESYDRARPSYPPTLIDDLTGGQPRRVLDVGCGTGIASRLFLDRDCEVLGVEPDPLMATVARRHGLTVEISDFESWDPAGRTFDLVISGQAWHWVDQDAGARQAARVLHRGGLLAPFWNGPRHRPEIFAAIAAAYRAHAPELLTDNVALGTAHGYRGQDTSADTLAIIASGMFEPPENRSYEWEIRHTPAGLLDELRTHSNHIMLPPERLAAVLDAIGAGLAHLDEFSVPYVTRTILARRS